MSNDFVHQFAVMMPNGELFCQPLYAAVENFSVPSPVRDMLGAAAMYGNAAPQPHLHVVGFQLALFENAADAQRTLDMLRDQAQVLGVSHWGGCVVERLCTPFTSAAPDDEFSAEVTHWLEQRGNGGQP